MLIILVERVKSYLDSEIVPGQAGFRTGLGTRDQLFNMCLIMEKMREANIPLFICFIDYSKAFDCINYNKLWSAMNKIGRPAHLIALFENLYDSQSPSIHTPAGETEYFCNGKGVRQGCILSPHLFNIYTEIIMRLAITEEHNVKIGGKTISNLRYADDTALLATTENKLHIILVSCRSWMTSAY